MERAARHFAKVGDETGYARADLAKAAPHRGEYGHVDSSVTAACRTMRHAICLASPASAN